MTLEIRNRISDSSQKQICGRCQSVVRSTGVYEGAIVIVRPSSETHKKTGWGNSTFLNKVTIPFDVALAVEKNGVIHYQIPIDLESQSHSGKLAKVEVFADNFGHDISPLI